MISRTSCRHGRFAAVLVVLAAILVPGTGAWAAQTPQISVANPRIAPDDQIQVQGQGFEPRQSIAIEVCGAPDTTGSLTCSPMTAAFEVPLNGTFVEDLVMAAPTGACPCLIAVRLPGRPPVTTPIELLNHPVADRVQTPEVVVDTARVTSVNGLLSLFTGRSSAELELELRNVGATRAQPTLLLEVASAGAAGSGEPVDDPGVAGVDPGSTTSVAVPVEFGSLTGGAYEISGAVVVGDMYAPVEASASVRPWGLYLLVGVGAAFAIRHLLRRRRGAPNARSAGPRQASPESSGSVHKQPGRRAARDQRRPLVQAAGLQEVAKVASGAGKAAAQAIAKAREAEQAERSEQVAAKRAESDDRQTSARLDALARGMAKPAVRAPIASAEQAAPRPPSSRRSASAATSPDALVGPPRLDRTPLTPVGGAEPAEAERGETSPELDVVDVVDGGAMAAALRARAAGAAAPAAVADASVVAEAMAAIRVHTAQTPARLPDPHAYVPPQRDRRAPKGGKRAAR